MKTADEILAYLEDYIQKGGKVSKFEQWDDLGLTLQIALGSEHQKLVELEQKVAEEKIRLMSLQEKRNVSEVELQIQNQPVYKEYRLQKLKVDRCEEMIKILKLRSRKEII